MFSLSYSRLIQCFMTGLKPLPLVKVIQSNVSSVSSNLNRYKYTMSGKEPCLVRQARGFSNSNEKPPSSERNLTSMPNYVWPNLIKTAKNFLYANFLLRSLDEQFDMKEFVLGSLQAIEIVSGHIARSEFDDLKGLVTESVIEQIKQDIKQFDLRERLELSISKDDVFIRFPYEIGILRDDTGDRKNGREVEITMVYHVMKGYRNSQDPEKPLNIVSIPEFEKNMRILNYRFIRTFAGPDSGEWVINALNHFKPLAYKNHM